VRVKGNVGGCVNVCKDVLVMAEVGRAEAECAGDFVDVLDAVPDIVGRTFSPRRLRISPLASKSTP